MFLTPSVVLFTLRILIRIFLVISSSSFILSWVGLELNTLAFIPLLLLEKNKISRESSIKYFLTQTLASLIFIFGIVCNIFMVNTILVTFIFLIRLGIKLGAAPFHSWLPSISKSCKWLILFTLLTIQKINPLIVLWTLDLNNQTILHVITISSLVVGRLLGLIQTDTRVLLAYSSINHVGWLLVGAVLSFYLVCSYLAIYMLMLIAIILLFKEINGNSNYNLHYNRFGLTGTCALYCLLYSLGGLPPFLGFLPKWIVLQISVRIGYYLLSLLIISIRLFTLYYYIRLGLSAFTLRIVKSNLLYTFGSTLSNTMIFLTSISFLGLPLVFLF